MLMRGQAQALIAAAHMQQGKVVDLDQLLAVEAARLGIELKSALPAVNEVLASRDH